MDDFDVLNHHMHGNSGHWKTGHQWRHADMYLRGRFGIHLDMKAKRASRLRRFPQASPDWRQRRRSCSNVPASRPGCTAARLPGSSSTTDRWSVLGTSEQWESGLGGDWRASQGDCDADADADGHGGRIGPSWWGWPGMPVGLNSADHSAGLHHSSTQQAEGEGGCRREASGRHARRAAIGPRGRN